MNVSAVGFLFQNKVKAKGLLKGKNYTCIIHKMNPTGEFSRNIISSPIVKTNTLEKISRETASEDILKALSYISSGKDKHGQFIGATIKDGVKETEIHSLFLDKLFAVRTRDAAGKNHFRILNRDNTKKLLSKNLYVNV